MKAQEADSGPYAYREAVVTTPGSRDLQRALPDALASNGLPPADRQQVLEMSKMLAGTVQSITELTSMIASLLLGSERSGFGADAPDDLLKYLKFSRGFRG